MGGSAETRENKAKAEIASFLHSVAGESIPVAGKIGSRIEIRRAPSKTPPTYLSAPILIRSNKHTAEFTAETTRKASSMKKSIFASALLLSAVAAPASAADFHTSYVQAQYADMGDGIDGISVKGRAALGGIGLYLSGEYSKYNVDVAGVDLKETVALLGYQKNVTDNVALFGEGDWNFPKLDVASVRSLPTVGSGRARAL